MSEQIFTSQEFAELPVSQLELHKFTLDSEGKVAVRVLGGAAGNMLSSVYDPGNIGANAFAMENMIEAADAKIMTAAERTKLSNALIVDDIDDTLAALDKLWSSTKIQNELNALDAAKLNISDIVDNLTSLDTNKALSANQGKLLKDMIDAINTLLTSDDTTLDELQEIVDYIKANKSVLDNLAISNIAGLQAALDGKAASSHTHVLADLPSISQNHFLGRNSTGNGDIEVLSATQTRSALDLYTTGQVDTALDEKANLSGGNNFGAGDNIIVTTADDYWGIDRSGILSRLGNNYVGTFSNDVFRFFANSTEYARINTSGEFGIGKTASAGIKLDVQGAGRFSDNLIANLGVYSQAAASATTGANECAFKSQNITSGAIWSRRVTNTNEMVFEYFNGASWANKGKISTSGKFEFGDVAGTRDGLGLPEFDEGQITNLDTFKKTGWRICSSTATGNPTNDYNWVFCKMINASYGFQEVESRITRERFKRYLDDGTWSNWIMESDNSNWASFTPSFGSGDDSVKDQINCKYSVVGKTIHFHINFRITSKGTKTGIMYLSPPIAANWQGANRQLAGYIGDDGGDINTMLGLPCIYNSTILFQKTMAANYGSYVTWENISLNTSICISGSYELSPNATY